MEENVKFSVVTVCYNAKKDLERTLQSLKSQTYRGFEWIVVDGASTDGTEAFLKHEKTVTRFVSEPDSGVYNAMNKSLDLCGGEFVIFMNAGDEFFNPFVLEKAAEALAENPDCSFLFGDACIVPEIGRPFFREYLEPIGVQNICHQSIFYKRTLFAQFGRYDEQFQIVADYDFNLRLLITHQIVPYHLNYPICKFYYGGLSSGAKYLKKQRADSFRLRLKWGEREKLSASTIVLLDVDFDADNFLEVWQKYNRSFARRLVYRVGDSAGFFSEINNMLFALVWAFDHKVRFELCSRFSNLGDVGWKDFFLPFTDEMCRSQLMGVNRRYLRKDDDEAKIAQLKKEENVQLLTQDVFRKFFENRNFATKVFDFQELQVAGNSFAVARAFALALYRLNHKTLADIQSLTSERLAEVFANGCVRSVSPSELKDEDFIAIQMRAGDIKKECFWRRQPILGAKPYAQYIRQFFYGYESGLLPCAKKVFVFADDFRLVRQLAFLLPEFRIFSLCTPLERGFDYECFMKQDDVSRHYGLLKILANIEICRRALLFVGTRVSNPSWFLRLIMPENKVRFVDCQRLMWQWQFDELMDGGGARIIKIAGVPMLKIVRTPTKMKYKLFSALPLYKIKQKGIRRVHYLFGFLPIWSASL